jgi:hypothetical protein
MPRSADDRPADFVDDDGGMTQDAAIDWLKHAYALSEGAAIPQLRRAWASGNVRGRTRRGWDYFEISEDGAIGRDGLPVDLAPYRCEGHLVHDIRLNADDFRSQIKAQIGKPLAPKPRRLDKPTQADLNKELLKFVEARGQKVKQSEAIEMLTKLGASWNQSIEAARTLPQQYRYLRGRTPL